MEKSTVTSDTSTDLSTMNLAEVCLFLYNSRRLLCFLTLLGALLGLTLEYCLPTHYKTVIQLSPPKFSQYGKLLLSEDDALNSESLFNQFAEQLSLKSNLLTFILQSGTYKQTQQSNPDISDIEKTRLVSELASRYKINLENPNNVKNNRSINLEIMESNNELAANEGMEYIRYTNDQVISTIKSEQLLLIKNKIERLNMKINLNNKAQEFERENKILYLKKEKQLAIEKINNSINRLAQEDKLQKNLLLSQLTEAYKLAEATKIIYPLSGLQFSPQAYSKLTQPNLCLMGTNYLRKAIELTKLQPYTFDYNQRMISLRTQLATIQNDPEIRILEQRAGVDTIYSDEPRDLALLHHLQHLTFDKTEIKAYNLTSGPSIELSRPGAKKLLMTIAGSILGFMLAVFIIILAKTLHKLFRQQQNLSSATV